MPIPGLEKTSPAFRQKATQVATRLGMNPEHLFQIMSFETGGTFSPSQRNLAGSSGTGLIQFMDDTAKSLGTSTDELSRMSAEDQLDYVERYFQPYRGKLNTLDNAYLAVLHPKSIGKTHTETLFPAESRNYGPNKGLDKEGKGFVTVGDAVKGVLNFVGGMMSPSSAEAASPVRTTASTSYDGAVLDAVTARDPRKAVIDVGLKLIGKRKEDFGVKWNDPAFVQSLFDATLSHAEQLEPTLTMNKGLGGYIRVLQNAVVEQEKEQKAQEVATPKIEPPKPIPAATPAGQDVSRVTDPQGQSFLPQTPSQQLDVITQTVRGAVVDPIAGLADTFDDLTKLLMKAVPYDPTKPGSYHVEGDEELPQPGESLQKFVDRLIGQPQTGTASLTRSLAGFLAPFMGITKLTGATGVVAGLAKEAAVNIAFIDPDDPLIIDLIDRFARGVSPNDPNSIRSAITKTIAGEMAEDELVKRFATRGIRMAENLPISLLAEGVMGVVRHLKGQKLLKGQLTQKQQIMAEEEARLTKVQEEAKTREMNRPISRQEAEAVQADIADLTQAEREMLVAVDEKLAARQTEQAEALIEQLPPNVRRLYETRTPRTDIPEPTKGETEAIQEDLTTDVVEGRERRHTEDIRLAQQQARQAEGLIETLSPAERESITTRIPGPQPELQGVNPLTGETIDLRPTPPAVQRIPSAGDTLMGTPVDVSMGPGGKRELSKAELEEAQVILDDMNANPESIAYLDDAMKWLEAVSDADTPLANTLRERIKNLSQIQSPQPAMPQTLRGKSTAPSLDEAARWVETLTNPPKDLVIPPKMKELIEKLQKTFKDPDITKLALTAIVRGGVTATAGSLLLDTGTAEADTLTGEKPDKSTFGKLATFLTLFGVGALTVPATRRALVRVMDHLAPQINRSIRDLKIGPPKPIKAPGQKLINIAPGERVAAFEEFEKRIAVRTDLLNEMDDVVDFFKEADELVPDYLTPTGPIPNAKLAQYAERIGHSPRELERLLHASHDPAVFSKRMLSLAAIIPQQVRRVKALELRIRNGENGLQDEFLKEFHLMGEFNRGLHAMESDLGRGLNVVRQLKNGQLGRVIQSGDVAGHVLATKETIDDLLARVRNLPDDKLPGFAGKVTHPTAGKAITEVFFQSILSGIGTPVVAGTSNMMRIVLEPFVRLGGALGPTIGTATKKVSLNPLESTPELGEFVVMWQSLMENISNGFRLGLHTMRTGETSVVERGTLQIGSERTPSFTSAVLAPEGSKLASVPFAANAIDGIGGIMRVVGQRPLAAISEVTQFLVERMELDAMAYRAAAAREFKTPDEYAKFIADFKEYPPLAVAEEVKRQKRTMDFMNSLFDSRGGFQGLRHASGYIQKAIEQVPFLRLLDPFLRAGTNGMVTQLEFTPVANLISRSFREELKSPDPLIQSAAQGKLFTSMGLGLLAMSMGAMGVSRGKLSNDPAVKEQFRQAGMPENSITLWGRTFALDPSWPISFVLKTYGELGAMARDAISPDEVNTVQALIGATVELFKDQLFLRSFGEIFSDADPRKIEQRYERAKKMGAGEVSATAQSGIVLLDEYLLSGIVPPRIVQDMRRLIDPYKRATDGLLEKLRSRTPGFSDDLPKETDIFGRPRFIGGGMSERTVDNVPRVFSGVPQANLPKDPLSDALMKKGVVIHDPRPVVSVKRGVDVPLSKKEQQRLRELIAHPKNTKVSLYDAVMKLTKDTRWNTLTEDQAQIVVSAVVSKYSEVARLQLLRESNEVRERLRARGNQTQLMPSQPQQ